MQLIQAASGRRDCGWKQRSKQDDRGARAGYFGHDKTRDIRRSNDRRILGQLMQEFLMSHPASPQEVVEAVMQGIADQNWQDLHKLYSEQAVVEHPFALPAPTRIEGHEAIRKHFANFAAAPLKLQIRNMVVRQTTDPEVIVAEWDYDGLVTTTGRMFRVSNIQVSRVRHGKIVESRDYHNHALMANVMGRLPVLVAALTEETTKPS